MVDLLANRRESVPIRGQIESFAGNNAPGENCRQSSMQHVTCRQPDKSDGDSFVPMSDCVAESHDEKRGQAALLTYEESDG